MRNACSCEQPGHTRKDPHRPGSVRTQARKQPSATTVLSVKTKAFSTPGTEKLSQGTICIAPRTLIACEVLRLPWWEAWQG